jgi:hypothetical protein
VRKEVKFSTNGLLLSLGFVVVGFCGGVLLRGRNAAGNSSLVSETSFQKDMNAYCEARLNDGYLSKLSTDAKKGLTVESFFSPKLHTCVEIEVTIDPKNSGAMNYVVSDLTYGFVASPTWHHNEMPLHIIKSDYGNYHHLYVEGYWASVSSDPGQQSVSNASKVKISCDYTESKRPGNDSNSCTETEGYVRFGTIDTDNQTYHIVSWSPDEVIATDVERGLSGATSTTLLIHPAANEIEIIDRTKMDEKQPKLFDGMAGKSFGDHYELHGGMYLFDTQGAFFQCDEDGVVIDMRLDVVQRHHGDVVNVPDSDWNTGSKAAHKFTQHECESAMQKKLVELK